MTKGIYFLDKNQSLLSDLESFFIVNDMVSYLGGTGLLQQAITDVQNRKDVDIIVITDNLVDATCVEALKALMNHPSKKIVALRSKDEVTKEKISQYAVVIHYPFSCNLIEETIKRMSDAPTYDESDLERMAESNAETDNPFSYAPKRVPAQEAQDQKKKPSFQERLKSIQLNRNIRVANRLISQKVIAIQSQKGGVGKSTISRELAISVRCARIKKESVEYTPKVCLCDFDLEGADIATIMDISDNFGILTWCEDIDYESQRTGDALSQIRFTEDVIKERYLFEHESGIYVLNAPQKITDAFKIDSAYIESIIENLKLCDFDVIVLDTGPNILDYTLTALSHADEIYAVCNCDMVSAKRIDGMTQDVFSKIRGFDFGKMKLLINNMTEKSAISAAEISSVLNLELVGQIPYFPEINRINNEGVSVFFNRKKLSGKAVEYADAFRLMARRIVCADVENSSKPTREYTVDGIETMRKKANFSIFRKI